jgi:hypothetical protein
MGKRHASQYANFGWLLTVTALGHFTEKMFKCIYESTYNNKFFAYSSKVLCYYAFVQYVIGQCLL